MAVHADSPWQWAIVGGRRSLLCRIALFTRRICDIYDFFAPHINVLTYLLTYLGLELGARVHCDAGAAAVDDQRPLANGLGVRLLRHRHAHQSRRGRQGATEHASERRLLIQTHTHTHTHVGLLITK